MVKLKVAFRNKSDKPISFLRWSTPFDPRAVPSGVFEFKSTATGELAPCLNLKLNRKMPESGTYDGEDIEHIDAGGETSKQIEIKAPEVVLSKGEKGDFESEGVEVEIA
ncbi:hypothetical protein CJF30_00008591 [Rutstroemia sp. NJR-2017a BBW]|nr:hypothetical protein CJF30_00008591 [Rutstroemia sp. NJR-2017a BBW]